MRMRWNISTINDTQTRRRASDALNFITLYSRSASSFNRRKFETKRKKMRRVAATVPQWTFQFTCPSCGDLYLVRDLFLRWIL